MLLGCLGDASGMSWVCYLDVSVSFYAYIYIHIHNHMYIYIYYVDIDLYVYICIHYNNNNGSNNGGGDHGGRNDGSGGGDSGGGGCCGSCFLPVRFCLHVFLFVSQPFTSAWIMFLSFFPAFAFPLFFIIVHSFFRFDSSLLVCQFYFASLRLSCLRFSYILFPCLPALFQIFLFFILFHNFQSFLLVSPRLPV